MRPRARHQSLLAALAPFVLLGSFPTSSAECSLARDQARCPATTLEQEYTCYRLENSMRQIMDCVLISPEGEDAAICDPIGNGRQNCVAPRDILIAGSSECSECSFKGLLSICPDKDPSFHSCLCHHRVQPRHFDCLSRCFGTGQLSDLSCRPPARARPPSPPPAGGGGGAPVGGIGGGVAPIGGGGGGVPVGGIGQGGTGGGGTNRGNPSGNIPRPPRPIQQPRPTQPVGGQLPGGGGGQVQPQPVNGGFPTQPQPRPGIPTQPQPRPGVPTQPQPQPINGGVGTQPRPGTGTIVRPVPVPGGGRFTPTRPRAEPRQDEADDEIKPPPERMNKLKRALLLEGADFFLNEFQEPVYPDGSVGYRLPFYDELIANGRVLKRCYISPTTTDVWCIAWRVPPDFSPDPEVEMGRAANAQYGDLHEDEDDIEAPTRSAGPGTRGLPEPTRRFRDEDDEDEDEPARSRSTSELSSTPAPAPTEGGFSTSKSGPNPTLSSAGSEATESPPSGSAGHPSKPLGAFVALVAFCIACLASMA